MKISIFGLAGTGTSSVGKKLALDLNFKFYSTGDLFRAEAKKLGLSLNEFEKLTQEDSSYDLALDDRVKTLGQQEDNFVIESRLAWHFIPDSIKIKLDCLYDVRVKRVASRESISFEVADFETKDREEKIMDRYRRYYGIDNCADNKNFDLVIDTTQITIDQVVDLIKDYINTK